MNDNVKLVGALRRAFLNLNEWQSKIRQSTVPPKKLYLNLNVIKVFKSNAELLDKREQELLRNLKVGLQIQSFSWHRIKQDATPIEVILNNLNRAGVDKVSVNVNGRDREMKLNEFYSLWNLARGENIGVYSNRFPVSKALFYVITW